MEVSEVKFDITNSEPLMKKLKKLKLAINVRYCTDIGVWE